MEYRKKNSSFRYEAMWERENSLFETVDSTWSRSATASSLEEMKEKLGLIQQGLQSWAKKEFGSIVKKTMQLRKKLESLWEGPPTAGRQYQINRVARELDEVLLREEIMWRQRSRTTWLKEGDKNTKYFQRKATWRRKKNTITRLKDGNGQWVEDKDGIQQMTTRFFKDLYTKYDKVAPQELINMMQARVNEDMNNMLTKDFTEKEISDALF